MPNITLYGLPVSTYVRTVRLLLHKAGADYDLKSIDIFKGAARTADYLAVHPFGKVPAVAVDGIIIYETAAITDYLDNRLLGGQLTPAEPLKRARMRQLIGIIDHYLYMPAVRTIAMQRLVAASRGEQPDEAAVSTALPTVQLALGAIEALITDGPFLLGDYSLADLYLIPIFVYLSKTPEFALATAAAPKLQAWWQMAKELPAVRAICR